MPNNHAHPNAQRHGCCSISGKRPLMPLMFRSVWARCRLTDDQLDVIAGKRDQLVSKIHETCGVSKDEVEKQISD